MILTQVQAIQIAHNAGFRNEGLVTIVAIGMAESGLDTEITATNPPDANCPDGSVDRGWLQFNSCYHADVSDACAFDPSCAASEAYRVTKGGTVFHEWASFQKGTYLAFVDAIRALVHALFPATAPKGAAVMATINVNQPLEPGVYDVTPHVDQPQGPPPETPPTDAKTYTVQSGDTLFGIAEHFTGDGQRYTELYQANVSVIGPDPNLIQPGQVLTLPAGW